MSKATTLTAAQINEVLQAALRRERNPIEYVVICLFAFDAGLRGQEIAALEFEDVTDARGDISDTVYISKRGGKNGKTRSVPMSDRLRAWLSTLITNKTVCRGPIFIDQYGKQITSNGLRTRMKTVFNEVGLRASSHSGRRSLLTRGSRIANQYGCSIQDLKSFAGHADLETTAQYIDCSDQQVRLINALANDEMYESIHSKEAAERRLSSELSRVSPDLQYELLRRGLVFATEADDGRRLGDVLAASWEQAEQLVRKRGSGERITGKIGISGLG